MLEKCDAQEEKEKFIKEKITTLKRLRKLTDQQLEGMGIPLGHRNEFLSYLKTLNAP